MKKSVFICGTDTGVGKTLVTGAICAWLNEKGIRAGAFKPLESGCGARQDGLPRHKGRSDSEFLKKMAGMKEPLNMINPYHFKPALAPGVAAEQEKVFVSFGKIKKCFQVLQKKYDVVFVEGAGGLMVPVGNHKTNVDLIRELKTGVIVIARLGLGTINHTLLTLNELKRGGIKVLGVILNETSPQKGLAEKTNPEVLVKYGAPLIGVFPHIANKSRQNLIGAVSKALGKKAIFLTKKNVSYTFTPSNQGY